MVRKVDLYLVANVGTFSIASKMVVISAIECSAKSFSAWSSVNGDFIFATDGKFFLISIVTGCANTHSIEGVFIYEEEEEEEEVENRFSGVLSFGLSFGLSFFFNFGFPPNLPMSRHC